VALQQKRTFRTTFSSASLSRGPDPLNPHPGSASVYFQQFIMFVVLVLSACGKNIV